MNATRAKFLNQSYTEEQNNERICGYIIYSQVGLIQLLQFFFSSEKNIEGCQPKWCVILHHEMSRNVPDG